MTRRHSKEWLRFAKRSSSGQKVADVTREASRGQNQKGFVDRCREVADIQDSPARWGHGPTEILESACLLQGGGQPGGGPAGDRRPLPWR